MTASSKNYNATHTGIVYVLVTIKTMNLLMYIKFIQLKSKAGTEYDSWFKVKFHIILRHTGPIKG